MIPVDTVVGLTSGWRFTQQHPVVTGVVVAVLLALAFLAVIWSKRSPLGRNLMRAVSLSLVIGAAGFSSWAYTTRSPGLAAPVEKLAGQVAIQSSRSLPRAE